MRCSEAKRSPGKKIARAQIFILIRRIDTFQRTVVWPRCCKENKGTLEHATSFCSAPRLDSRNVMQLTVELSTGMCYSRPQTQQDICTRAIFFPGDLFASLHRKHVFHLTLQWPRNNYFLRLPESPVDHRHLVRILLSPAIRFVE